MAFRTNKMPVLQEKSASGAVASFNTALAMPLIKCEVSFSAIQSGSGTPSPNNQRDFVGVSSLDVVVNGSTISKALGDTYYGGVLDVVSGVMVITRGLTEVKDIPSNTIIYIAPTESMPLGYFNIRGLTDKANGYQIWSNIYIQTSSFSDDYSMKPNSSTYIINIVDSRFNSIPDFKNNSGAVFEYLLATPFTVQLTPTQIKTIIGDNTISSTGDVDLTFKDLDLAKRGNFREVFKLPS